MTDERTRLALITESAEFADVLKHFDGFVDKGDHPYIGHLLRVAMDPECHHPLAALLHDLVEDVPGIDMVYVRERFPEHADIVDALTKRSGESVKDYYMRVCAVPAARNIKMADLRDNIRPERIANPTDVDQARILRYSSYLDFLTHYNEWLRYNTDAWWDTVMFDYYWNSFVVGPVTTHTQVVKTPYDSARALYVCASKLYWLTQHGSTDGYTLPGSFRDSRSGTEHQITVCLKHTLIVLQQLLARKPAENVVSAHKAMLEVLYRSACSLYVVAAGPNDGRGMPGLMGPTSDGLWDLWESYIRSTIETIKATRYDVGECAGETVGITHISSQISELFRTMSYYEVSQAVLEIREDSRTGIVRDGVLRRKLAEMIAITGEESTIDVSIVEAHILREAAYRFTPYPKIAKL